MADDDDDFTDMYEFLDAVSSVIASSDPAKQTTPMPMIVRMSSYGQLAHNPPCSCTIS